jgi:hypothetical protein
MRQGSAIDDVAWAMGGNHFWVLLQGLVEQRYELMWKVRLVQRLYLQMPLHSCPSIPFICVIRRGLPEGLVWHIALLL